MYLLSEPLGRRCHRRYVPGSLSSIASAGPDSICYCVDEIAAAVSGVSAASGATATSAAASAATSAAATASASSAATSGKQSYTIPLNLRPLADWMVLTACSDAATVTQTTTVSSAAATASAVATSAAASSAAATTSAAYVPFTSIGFPRD